MNRQPSLDNCDVGRMSATVINGYVISFSINPGGLDSYTFDFDGDIAVINFAKCDHCRYEECVDDCKMLMVYGPSKLDLHRWQYEHNHIYSLVLHHFKLYVRDIIAGTYNGTCPRITFEI